MKERNHPTMKATFLELFHDNDSPCCGTMLMIPAKTMSYWLDRGIKASNNCSCLSGWQMLIGHFSNLVDTNVMVSYFWNISKIMHDIPWAARHSRTILMIPAKTMCPTDWKEKYIYPIISKRRLLNLILLNLILLNLILLNLILLNLILLNLIVSGPWAQPL